MRIQQQITLALRKTWRGRRLQTIWIGHQRPGILT